jgi:MoxR-like ATPase
MPVPFHILATENPIEYEGTFPLPETQLDRFFMRINLGYPSLKDEIAIIDSQRHIHPVEGLSSVINKTDYLHLQNTVRDIYVDDLIKQYIVSIIAATRHHQAVFLGASPRGSLALYRAAQARALLQNRDYVLPDDIKYLAVPVLAHRIILHTSDSSQGTNSRSIISQILETVPVPGGLPGNPRRHGIPET